MKLYTFYTDSHNQLFNELKESLSNTNSKIEIIADYFDQECDGNFMSSGWNDTMSKKVQQIINSCKNGETFIHSDCDVYFFKDIYNDIISEIGDYDIAFQNDSASGYCMGFFICKPSPLIIDLFENVKRYMKQFGNDQLALNGIIKSYPLKYKMLSNKFFSYGQLNRGVWKGEDFKIPDISVLHANWTIGVESKIQLINKIKSQYDSK